MKLADFASEKLFEESDVIQLEDGVENPKWSAPMDLSDFLEEVKKEVNAS